MLGKLAAESCGQDARAPKKTAMGQALVDKLLTTIHKTKWPAAARPTQLGRQTYEVGLDKVDEYGGDPKTLEAALRIFKTGDSRPYALAGVAYALLMAAHESDGPYAPAGLAAASDWLAKAQGGAEDRVDIHVVEALIYIYGGRLDNARTILDYLGRLDPDNYHLSRAEAIYWRRANDLQEAAYWYNRAIKQAETVPRRLRLRAQLADAYLQYGRLDDALQLYLEAVQFAPSDPRLWHNLSLIYWQRANYEEAGRCNKKALALRDFPEARQMEAQLRSQLGGGLLGRLFGR